MKSARFIYEGLKHPKQIGTLTQSSRFLANDIARKIEGKNIIELG